MPQIVAVFGNHVNQNRMANSEKANFTRKYLYCFVCLVFGLNSCGGQAPASEKKTDVQEKTDNPVSGVKEEKVISVPEKKEELVIFDMMPVEGNPDLGFISLSDVHPISEHPDSLAIPDVSEKPIDSIRYFKLEKKYRKRFLTATGISENDKVFLFDYSTDMMVSFPVSKLNVVANLNIYASDEDAPFSQLDYMIGFEVNKKDLKGLKNQYFGEILVSVGKESPFVRGKLKPITWKKINKKEFPLAKMSREGAKKSKKYVAGNTYTFTKDSLQYFVQELSKSEYGAGRRLLVLNTKTDKIMFERVYEEGEGVSMAPLNHKEEKYEFLNQWTGQLFKDRAPVLFGFQYFSFSCPEISFLEKGTEDIYLNCDNRH